MSAEAFVITTTAIAPAASDRPGRGANVLVSVNVGLPKDVEWHGERVRTSVWKEPVPGRVLARRLNLDGDRQGDLASHGGEHRAVMVYQLGSYRYWQEFLGRSDLVHGNFGENFTVEGLADDDVCIGDRFRIGGAIFEVSQPRVTCYRVGLRLDVPEMAALLVSRRRPGFYFRVLQEGEVGAGDRIEKIGDGPERMTVAEINTLLYSSKHPVAALRRAIRIPALSAGWRGSMEALLDAAEQGRGVGNAGLSLAPMGAVSWTGFRSLKVVASAEESVGVRSFELGNADGSALPAWLPGQHVVVRVRPDAAAPPVVRNYSLCGEPAAATYTIAVKDEGRGASAFLHEQVRAGNVLEVSAPRGAFTLDPGTKPVVFLSGGIGITPLLAMLRAMARGDAPAREVWWFHAARDKAHQTFAAQVRALMTSLKGGHFYTAYSRPSLEDRAGVDFDLTGRLTAAIMAQTGVPRTADFYLCGPPEFLTSLADGLKGWGVSAAQIHVELFGAFTSLKPGVVGPADRRPHLPDGPEGSGPRVTFLRSDITLRWDARFRSVLELAEACSVPVKWSCRSGVCHLCESGLVEGRVRYLPDPLDPPPEGTALICCSTPLSDVTLDL